VKGLSEDAIFARIGALNSPATPFMPPFTGTEEERRALAAYLAYLVQDKQQPFTEQSQNRGKE